MDCSDDSFALTDASSDSSIMTPELEQEDHDESGLDYKSKIQKELLNDHPIKGKSKKKKRKASEMLDCSPTNNNKNIKSEPESDIEAPKKKKKRKNTESENRLEVSQDTLLAEDYLNLRVKQEQLSFAEPEPVKKKKNKKHKKEKFLDFETQDSESTETLTIGNESEINNIDDNSLNNYDKTFVEIEKFEAEETLVQKKKKKKKQDPNCNTIEAKETLQTNSSDNLPSDNITETDQTDKPVITNGEIESDSDFEPKRKHIKPAPDIKTVNSKKKSKKSEKELPTKSTKITDRFTFEDEESIDSEILVGTTSKQLQQFVNNNTKLKVCAPKVQKENTITDDDEVWIFRIPKEVDINDLKDLNFILDTKWKTKINGLSYDGIIENHSSQMPFLCYEHNKCQIKNMPLMGEVSLRKRIPKAHIPQETCMVNNQTNFIPLPETKCRHPLFGVNYKKAIKVPRTIAERLNGNIDNDTLSESFSGKKEKKKHKKEKKKIEKESEPEVDIEVLQSPNPKKKKRKRKHSEMMQDTSTTKSKKSKCANLEPDSAEAWESERAIEANLFNF